MFFRLFSNFLELNVRHSTSGRHGICAISRPVFSASEPETLHLDLVISLIYRRHFLAVFEAM